MQEKVRKITVRDPNNERIDRYLSRKLGYTRSKIKKMIESGLVTVNGESKNAHYRVTAGEIIAYTEPEMDRDGIPDEMPLDIIHEDEHFAVINKPPGLVVHPTACLRSGTLLNGLMAKYPTPHIVHRLDKDTSGLIAVALDDDTALDLRRQFKKKTVKKIYLAIVNGIIKDDAGEISVPIRRSRRDPTKMSVGWSDARESTTRFTVKERLKGATYLEVYPISGRTHQIRVHLSYYGYPIIGDTKYSKNSIKAPRQMLHAWMLSFEDRLKKARINFEAPLPRDFKSVLKRLS